MFDTTKHKRLKLGNYHIGFRALHRVRVEGEGWCVYVNVCITASKFLTQLSTNQKTRVKNFASSPKGHVTLGKLLAA